MAQPSRVKFRTKIRIIRPNKEPKPPRWLGRTRNKSLIELNKTVTGKKSVPLLPGPTLLPQRKKQARIGSEARIETFPRSLAIVATRRGIIQGNVPNQKTSFGFDDLFVSD